MGECRAEFVFCSAVETVVTVGKKKKSRSDQEVGESKSVPPEFWSCLRAFTPRDSFHSDTF
jgi:hypothetical protein